VNLQHPVPCQRHLLLGQEWEGQAKWEGPSIANRWVQVCKKKKEKVAQSQRGYI
jgi:hypothetical protein